MHKCYFRVGLLAVLVNKLDSVVENERPNNVRARSKQKKICSVPNTTQQSSKLTTTSELCNAGKSFTIAGNH